MTRIILSFVLFLSACSAGERQKKSAPITVENVGKMSDNPFDRPVPTLESNRAAFVEIEYRLLNKYWGTLETEHHFGLIVGPYTVLDFSNCWFLDQGFERLILRITVRSALGRWPDVYAVVAAPYPSADSAEIVLLTTSATMPEQAIVLGEVDPDISWSTDGYRFEIGEHQLDDVRQVDVFTEIEPSGELCWADGDQIGGTFVIWPIFDKEHRLVCIRLLPARKLEGFLRDNGVSVVTK